jgi:hypothetical protein
VQLLDAEAVDEFFLHLDEVADGDDGEAVWIGFAQIAIGLAGIGIDGSRPRRRDGGIGGAQVHQRVRREHEILIGIDRLAGADDGIPVAGGLVALGIFAGGMTSAGEEVADEDRVRLVGIERAVAFPTDFHALEGAARLRRERRQIEHLLLRDQVLGLGRQQTQRHQSGGSKSATQHGVSSGHWITAMSERRGTISLGWEDG